MTVDLCSAWLTDDDLTDDESPYCSPCAADADAVKLEQMLWAGSYILAAQTGWRWVGVCEETVRPCASRAAGHNAPVWHGSPLSSAWNGWWEWLPSWGVCGCGGIDARACSCSGPSEVQVGGRPLVAVTEVKVDGVALDPAEYRIDDDAFLVRLPNVGDVDQVPQSWPCCQRLDLPDTEVGTWSVTRQTGTLPPRAGLSALASFVCDLLGSCDGECSIPENVANLVRGNVTYDLSTYKTDPSVITGNVLADQFIRSVTAPAAPAKARVWSPDVGPAVRRTGTGTVGPLP